MEIDAWGIDSYFTYVNTMGPQTSYMSVPPGIKMMMCSGSTAGTGVFAGFRFGRFLAWYPAQGKLYPKDGAGYLSSYPLTGNLGHSTWQYTC
jgi:hypothetical protein